MNRSRKYRVYSLRMSVRLQLKSKPTASFIRRCRNKLRSYPTSISSAPWSLAVCFAHRWFSCSKNRVTRERNRRCRRTKVEGWKGGRVEEWECCAIGFCGVERAFVTKPVIELREKLGGEALAPPGAARLSSPKSSPMPDIGLCSP